MRRVLSCCLLLFALVSVLIFIWGDLFIAEFQSDTADTLLWAKATYESGSLVNSDFYYPYTIPFGGNILLLPFFSLFGIGITAIRCGMTLFVVLLTLAFVFFFDKAAFRSRCAAFSATGLMLMLFLTNIKLREIMFGHIIHYSLAIVFMLLLYTFLTLYLKSDKKRVMLACLAALTAFVSAADGAAIIALGLAPVLGAFVIERFIHVCILKKPYPQFKNDFIFFCVLLVSAGCGFVLYSILQKGAHTPYSANYFVILPPSEWLGNLRGMAHEWANWLFRPKLYADAAVTVQELSAIGVFFARTAKSLMLASPIALLILTVLRYRRLQTRSERIVVLSFWVLAVITVGLYVLTPANTAGWRMIPMLAMMFVCWLVLIRSMLLSADGGTRVLAISLAGIIAAFSLNAGAGVIAAKAQPEVWLGEGSLIDVLKENDAEYCFCDGFHFCPSVYVLSDGEINVNNVELKNGRLNPKLNQNDISDFEYQEGSRVFFIRTAKFDEPLPEGGTVIHSGTTFLPSYTRKTDRFTEYEIIVYDKNPLEPYFVVGHSNTVLDKDGREVAPEAVFNR